MTRPGRWFVAGRSFLAVAAVSALVACGPAPAAAPKESAVVVQKDEATGIARIALSEHAAKRLGIAIAQVAPQQPGDATRTVIPYSAVVYDAQGRTWTYTNVEGLTFVRQEITVDRIDEDQAFLLAGPPVGTRVVTVGAPELWGAETGVGGGH